MLEIAIDFRDEGAELNALLERVVDVTSQEDDAR